MRLVWDKIEERTYDLGLDRGVLYLYNRKGVAWSGLTAVEQNSSGEGTVPVYFDGFKVLDRILKIDETFTIKALVYPDEFMYYERLLFPTPIGNEATPRKFDFSFRTKTESGYKIHLLYNLIAVASPRDYSTVSNTVNTMEFSWVISGLPETVEGAYPTEYYIIETSEISPVTMRLIEGYLYGSDTTQAYLPPIQDLVYILQSYEPYYVLSSGNGLYPLSTNEFEADVVKLEGGGFYQILPESRIVETSTEGLYELGV